jgi:outer membrane protein assembly factor BamB
MRPILLLGLAFLPVTSALAADWPQFLGPNRDNTSPESVEPWTGELRILWKQPVGEGHSSPVVAGGRVFTHAKQAGREGEEVVARDAATGNQLWRQAYNRPKFENFFGNGPRSTPVVDGDHVYTLGVSGILACWKTADGEEVWKTNILEQFKAANLFFGVSTSPIVAGDKLLVLVGGPDASIVAFEKTTGKVAWKSGSDKAAYASPLITQHGGKPLALFLTHEGVTAIDPADGKRFWQFPLVDMLAESSTTPVRVGDMLFASSVTYGSVGLKLTEKDGQPGYEQVWKDPKLPCYFGTPVAFGEYLYVVRGSVTPPASLCCVEAKTGKVAWTRPNVGQYHATVMRVKDRLLLLEESGSLVLIEHNPKEYKELARAKVCGKTWAHPALSDGRLFVRDEREVRCVEVRKN